MELVAHYMDQRLLEALKHPQQCECATVEGLLETKIRLGRHHPYSVFAWLTESTGPWN